MPSAASCGSTGVRVCLVQPGPIKTEFTEALHALVPPGGRPDPILDNAAPWMTADVDEVARRIVGLIDRPRRRLSVLRRFVWIFRILGAVASLCPPIGDRFVVKFSNGGLNRDKRDPTTTGPRIVDP